MAYAPMPAAPKAAPYFKAVDPMLLFGAAFVYGCAVVYE